MLRDCQTCRWSSQSSIGYVARANHNNLDCCRKPNTITLLLVSCEIPQEVLFSTLKGGQDTSEHWTRPGMECDSILLAVFMVSPKSVYLTNHNDPWKRPRATISNSPTTMSEHPIGYQNLVSLARAESRTWAVWNRRGLPSRVRLRCQRGSGWSLWKDFPDRWASLGQPAIDSNPYTIVDICIAMSGPIQWLRTLLILMQNSVKSAGKSLVV